MGTTTGGIPWPNGSDPVRDGDNAMKALAERVDRKLGNGAVLGGYDIAVLNAAATLDNSGLFKIPWTGLFTQVTGVILQEFQTGSDPNAPTRVLRCWRTNDGAGNADGRAYNPDGVTPIAGGGLYYTAILRGTATLPGRSGDAIAQLPAGDQDAAGQLPADGAPEN